MLIVAERNWTLRISHNRIYELLRRVKLGRTDWRRDPVPRHGPPGAGRDAGAIMMPAGLVLRTRLQDVRQGWKDLPSGSSLLPGQLIHSGFDLEDQPESHHADREALHVSAGDNASRPRR